MHEIKQLVGQAHLVIAMPSLVQAQSHVGRGRQLAQVFEWKLRDAMQPRFESRVIHLRGSLFPFNSCPNQHKPDARHARQRRHGFSRPAVTVHVRALHQRNGQVRRHTMFLERRPPFHLDDGLKPGHVPYHTDWQSILPSKFRRDGFVDRDHRRKSLHAPTLQGQPNRTLQGFPGQARGFGEILVAVVHHWKAAMRYRGPQSI